MYAPCCSTSKPSCLKAETLSISLLFHTTVKINCIRYTPFDAHGCMCMDAGVSIHYVHLYGWRVLKWIIGRWGLLSLGWVTMLLTGPPLLYPVQDRPTLCISVSFKLQNSLLFSYTICQSNPTSCRRASYPSNCWGVHFQYNWLVRFDYCYE